MHPSFCEERRPRPESTSMYTARTSSQIVVAYTSAPAVGLVMPFTGTTTVWCKNMIGDWPVYLTSRTKCS